MTEITLLLVASLATWQIVEIWRHSALMAESRARAQTYDGLLATLLGCPFCLSVWAALGCVLVLRLPWSGVPWFDAAIAALRILVWSLAASRLANLGNDLAYAYTRTPRHDAVAIDEDVVVPFPGTHDDDANPSTV